MQTLKLVIGSKNSSSWSLRPWLLLKQVGLPFEETVIPLRRPDSRERILAVSPSGKLPVLVVGDVRVWDSLAICEFLAEHDPSLWPADSRARALARSISAEMHSGFQALRTFLPMDFAARFGPPGKLLAPVRADVDRVLAIWDDCRRQYGHGGPFLFGPFTIADAMFAPVCSRFTTHAVPLDPVCAAYVERVMTLPAMQEWGRGAAAEVAGVPLPLTGMRERAPTPARLPASFAPEVVMANVDERSAQRHPAVEPSPATGPAPRPPEPEPPPPRTPSPHDAPDDIRRALRPIPSTVIVKPIGDHSHRGRKPR
jgi:glutathione S-transferase